MARPPINGYDAECMRNITQQSQINTKENLQQLKIIDNNEKYSTYIAMASPSSFSSSMKVAATGSLVLLLHTTTFLS